MKALYYFAVDYFQEKKKRKKTKVEKKYSFNISQFL